VIAAPPMLANGRTSEALFGSARAPAAYSTISGSRAARASS
jgi:hypothetical protein